MEISIEYYEGGKALKIDAKNYPKLATIEDDPNIMSIAIKKVYEDFMISQIVIEQEETITYYEDTIKILREFGEIYYKIKDILKNYYIYLLSSNPLYFEYKKVLELLDKEFLKDPIGVYLYIKRLRRKLLFLIQKNKRLEPHAKPLLSLIENFLSEFESKNFYKYIKDFLPGYKIGNREIYRRLFLADIRPKFISLKYISKIPENAVIIETYNLDEDTEVTIFKTEDSTYYYYYIFPEEYKLYEEEMFLLNKARDVMSQYQPKKEDYMDPERLKEIYSKIAENILISLSNTYKIYLNRKSLEKIKNILLRYTIGFGILEKIAKDENLQDIFINPPPGLNPISVLHSEYDLCITNVIPTKRELESWATKLRLISGRPFDEANPVLDTEIFLGNIRLRVAAIMEPLSPKGLSYVFRRHRTRPWTLPLFIKNKMLDSFTAGLLSFLVENGRTILIAGTRGAGKTSLLSSLLLELPRKYRIITIEDTLEIPSDYLRKLGYNIVPMKVRSPFSLQTTELSAEDGLRVSLRLGDSVIVLGEVRSKEAKVLYEAMRVGALANAVLGTIHAESPYGVYDRVVNDLGVPKTSFKATDIIIIANPIKIGLRKYRRVIRVTEVRKDWEEDPLKEKGFIDLLIYDSRKDMLTPTLDLIHGNSEILKSIASRRKDIGKSWEILWENIILRKEIKELILKYSSKNKNILEADFIVKANEIFYKIYDEVVEEIGFDKNEIIRRFERWLRKNI